MLFACLAAVLAASCGAGDPSSGPSCDRALDCGQAGEAICVDSHCRFFDDDSGFGSAEIALSFGRDMVQVAASGYIHVLLAEDSGGRPIDCQAVLGGELDPRAETLNPLVANPKYLVFHWDYGGTFFPGNLLQFIRPADRVLFVAQGYAQLDGQGPQTALGCTPWEEGIQVDRTAELSIQLVRP